MLDKSRPSLSAAAKAVAKKLEAALLLVDGGAAVAAIEADPAAARELLSQRPEEREDCRAGMARLMGAQRGYRDESKRLAQPRRALVGLLEKHGWSMPRKAEQDMARGAWERGDAPALEWLAGRGVFDVQFEAEALKAGLPILRPFAEERGRELRALAAMVDARALVDAPGRVGFTDFASAGLHACSKLLAERGFKPRGQVVPVASSGSQARAEPGMSAVCAFLCGALVGGSALGDPEKVRLCFERLAWLKGAGAPFAGEEARDPLKDPFAVAAQRGGLARDKLAAAGYLRLLRELRLLGADPNASGFFLSREVEKELRGRGDPQASGLSGGGALVGNALALGADPRLDGGRALMACVEVPRVAERLRVEMFKALVKRGAKPRGVDGGRPPFARAIEAELFELGLLSLASGDDPAWRGADGESALGLLCSKAPQGRDEARALVERFMAYPKVALALDEPGASGRAAKARRSKAAESAESAESDRLTPLARACARGSLGAVEALLMAGADVEGSGPSGNRALAVVGTAMPLGKPEWAQWQVNIVEALLAAGADPAAVDAKGRAPLQALAGSLVFDACERLARANPSVFGSDAHGLRARAALSTRGGRGVAIVDMAEILVASSGAEAPARASVRPRL